MTNEQKIKVLAEMDGCDSGSKVVTHEHEFYYMLDGRGATLYRCKDYLTSYDAIIPLIVKWCDKNWMRWNKIILHLGTNDARQMFSKSPEQLSNALIKSAGKWEN